MARIKLVLNERRLGLIAATGPDLPEPAVRVPEWMDPMGTHAAIRGIAKVPEIATRGKGRKTRVRGEMSQPNGRAAQIRGDDGLQEEGQGEKAVVDNKEVGKEEVESRDEGWGGGREAKEFVEDTEVEGGIVKRQE